MTYNQGNPLYQVNPNYWGDPSVQTINGVFDHLSTGEETKPVIDHDLNLDECQPEYFNNSPGFTQFDPTQFDTIAGQSPYIAAHENQRHIQSHSQVDILGNKYPQEGSISDSSSTPNNTNFHQSPDSNNSGALDPEPQPQPPKQAARSSTKPSTKTKKQLLDEQDAILIAKDDSELNEDELQAKRKAQNRAAQRAFRERKESKLKELEAKLLESDRERQHLLEKLEAITKQNMYILTENEILKSSKGNQHLDRTHPETNRFTFPKSQSEFIEGLVGPEHPMEAKNLHKVYDNPEHPGRKILAIGAVWDYIQVISSEKNLDYDTIDIDEIMGKLKGHERCHGFGPAYPLDLVDKVINECCDTTM